MLTILNRRLTFGNEKIISKLIKRYFLSNEYKCSEVWNNRLKNETLQNIAFDEMYYQLNTTFKSKKKVNILDIDLFASGLKENELKNEVEDLLFSLRQVPECGILPERTIHAVLRLYLDSTPEELFSVLSDRTSYGLFLDNYLTNLYLDRFLRDKDFKSAVKIAVLQMLQENFDNPIMKPLALHSCYQYLASPDIWNSLVIPEPDPHEEVVKVRVPFVRNPYHDDHFDITNTNHLVGKTLWLFGIHLNDSVGLSSQLVGLVLYEKYEKAVSLLEDIVNNNLKIHEEAVEKAKAYSLKQPKVLEENSQEEGTNAKEEEKKNSSKSSESSDPHKSKFLQLLESIDKKNLIKMDLLTETEKLAKEAVEKHEKEEIKIQSQIYKKWEEEREQHIRDEIEKCEKEKIKLTIQQELQELKEKEEQIFFFDNEEEMEMKSEESDIKRKNIPYYIPKGRKKHLFSTEKPSGL